ncbi:hypothetical protein FGB62_12g257 [Gracilaria domingensis]|nr:hypothetical protein FGB62_12g257 [Gracilaria domingensis]
MPSGLRLGHGAMRARHARARHHPIEASVGSSNWQRYFSRKMRAAAERAPPGFWRLLFSVARVPFITPLLAQLF